MLSPDDIVRKVLERQSRVLGKMIGKPSLLPRPGSQEIPPEAYQTRRHKTEAATPTGRRPGITNPQPGTPRIPSEAYQTRSYKTRTATPAGRQTVAAGTGADPKAAIPAEAFQTRSYKAKYRPKDRWWIRRRKVAA